MKGIEGSFSEEEREIIARFLSAATGRHTGTRGGQAAESGQTKVLLCPRSCGSSTGRKGTWPRSCGRDNPPAVSGPAARILSLRTCSEPAGPTSAGGDLIEAVVGDAEVAVVLMGEVVANNRRAGLDTQTQKNLAVSV